MRIHTLAKELGLQSKDLMEMLAARGIQVKNHMSSVDDGMAAHLRIIAVPDADPEEPEEVSEPEAAHQSDTAGEVVKTPVEEAVVEPAVDSPSDPVEAAVPEVVETPVVETPVVETPVVEIPVVEVPVVEIPVVDAPDEEAASASETEVAAEDPERVEAATEKTKTEELVEASEPEDDSVAEVASAEAVVDEPSPASAPKRLSEEDLARISPKRKKAAKIVMAPGFGGTPRTPATPVVPVAQPLPSGASSPIRKPRGRPLIIRSKAPTRPPPPNRAPRRAPGGPGGGPGGRPGGGAGGRPGGGRPPGRGPGGASSGPPQGGKKVMVFPGADTTGGPPRRSGPPGRGGPAGKGRGRQGGRPRRQESDFTRRRLQQEILPEDLPDQITLEEPASIKDLSLALGIKQTALLKKLMNHGMLANVNSPLTEEITDVLSVEISCEILLVEPKAMHSSLDELDQVEDAEEDLILRAPVVTLMGHVDHGKTTLLDKIRESSITKSESGGITQHMSAYRVDKGNAHVVFVDTPGHKAFTSMRSRGANVTDVVVLVVAADDGPMPQTEEAIQHAKAAGVPIVVAINKIDREGASADKVKAQLAELGVSPVEWGGTTEMIPVSALTGEGVDLLLEQLSLESEILELKANPSKNAIGTVLDSRASTGQGNVITALIQDGTLRPGDSVVCGPAHGKIRTLRSTSGVNLKSAPPATPVEITGLNDLPEAGDRLYALEDAAKAKQIAEERQEAKSKTDRAERQKVTLEGLFDKIDEAKTREIKVVLKTDVKGTLEVLKGELAAMRTSEVAIRVIRSGVGEISESDILLADASKAIVIGFHVSAADRARSEADTKGVEIRTYSVIYEILDDMRKALEGMLAPDISEEVQGKVEIQAIFKSTKLGNIAGCIGRQGIVTRDDKIRLLRDGEILHEGRLASLRRDKDDAKEIREGFECGIVIQGFKDIQVGDFIESIKVIKTTRTLEESEARSE
ncbi:MAG: translation initiation factor IF-2 [Planctomycetota bacterium]|nr:translation initiation factor IF-2 [Planctomycetota bacterium]